MCGVLGAAHWAHTNQYGHIKQALQMIAKRGPDDYGFVEEAWYQAAHTRLSIQDLSWRGHQPFHHPNGRYVVVYNGEIYNFRALNEVLRSGGVDLQSSSDTETMIHWFSRKGIAALSDFQGMFAGAIFDRELHEVHLFRDRLGVKPLFYHLSNRGVAFASNPAAVSQLLGGLAIEKDEFLNYLAFRTPRVEASMFKGVKSLTPGTVLTISKGGVVETEYWSLAEHFGSAERDMSADRAIENTRALIQQSVEKRLISDVPVGTFLSGGLDSTIILHHMSKIAESDINTHSFTSLAAETDEVSRARRTAREYGASFSATDLDHSGYLKDLNLLMQLKGAPLTVQNEYAIFKMSQRMKTTNSVVLSGEGADEIFWGYSNIFAAAAQRNDLKGKADIARWIFKVYRYVSPQALNAFGYGASARRRYQDSGISYIEALLSDIEGGNTSENLQYFFLRHHLPGLLGRLDNATMAAAIEGRVPFTDHALVEFALKVPARLKLSAAGSPFSGKRILYESYADLLPEWVVNTPKIGFKIGDTIRGSREVSTQIRGLTPNTCSWLDTEIASPTERWHLSMLSLFAAAHEEDVDLQ